VDKIWGSHALDEERCREMFKSAIDVGATMDQVAGEAERYLKSSGAQQSHIDKQIAKIRNMEILDVVQGARISIQMEATISQPRC
jgi:hypothetical protein